MTYSGDEEGEWTPRSAKLDPYMSTYDDGIEMYIAKGNGCFAPRNESHEELIYDIEYWHSEGEMLSGAPIYRGYKSYVKILEYTTKMTRAFEFDDTLIKQYAKSLVGSTIDNLHIVKARTITRYKAPKDPYWDYCGVRDKVKLIELVVKVLPKRKKV